MSAELFDNGIIRVLVPTGWKLFYGIDSECKTSLKKLHIYKGAKTEFDIFSMAGITICYYSKDDIYVSIKDFYDNVQDISPFVCGNYEWNGYTCTSLGYPYTMLTATSNGETFYVMILTENGEHKISLDDADVLSILESIESCQ